MTRFVGLKYGEKSLATQAKRRVKCFELVESPNCVQE